MLNNRSDSKCIFLCFCLWSFVRKYISFTVRLSSASRTHVLSVSLHTSRLRSFCYAVMSIFEIIRKSTALFKMRTAAQRCFSQGNHNQKLSLHCCMNYISVGLLSPAFVQLITTVENVPVSFFLFRNFKQPVAYCDKILLLSTVFCCYVVFIMHITYIGVQLHMFSSFAVFLVRHGFVRFRKFIPTLSISSVQLLCL